MRWDGAVSRGEGLLGLLGMICLVSACGHTEPFVWIESVPRALVDPPAVYVIGPGDGLAIRVWEQDAMSTHARVREDGKISFPLVDDLEAAGNTPVQLARGVEEILRAKNLLNHPRVTVSVEEARQNTVTVFGEVSHAGSFPITTGAGLLQAIASAGGLTEFADPSQLFLLRPGLNSPRIRFRYQDLLKSANRAADFRLANGDVIIVE